MELYYKDLISEEASLEKLVDDLMLVVQGADEFVQAAGVDFQGLPREEILSRLARLKQACRRIEERAGATALKMDKLLRQYPYSVAGFAFAFGLLAGRLIGRPHARRRGDVRV
jgi:ElaB/YqjD/DUF883 family membrane-anchored ribosome-binding protein